MTTATPASSQTRPDAKTPAYAWYVLFVLFLANSFNAMDRSIITLLIEPIRRDLGLNDTQMGLITGMGYALVYVAFSVPVARLIDAGNRTRLLAAGIAFWSIMTALTGQVTGFYTMLLARFGVAAGESTCMPAGLSLIADYFQKAKRSRAIGIFQLGSYGGMIAGAILAGVISAHHGWRVAFYFLGLPGLILALIVWLTVKEPPRGLSDDDRPKASMMVPGGLGVMRDLLASNRGFLLLFISAVLMTVAQVVMGSWVPAFLMRIHGVSQEAVGVLAGPVVGLGGVFGTLAGGFVGTWLAKREGEDRAPLKVMLFTAPLAVPAILVFLFAPTLTVSLVAGSASAFLLAAHFGPLMAVAISLFPGERRGSAASLLVIGQYLLGFGLGPLFVGGVSDLLEPALGIASLRYAMVLAPICVALGVILALAAYRTLKPAK